MRSEGGSAGAAGFVPAGAIGGGDAGGWAPLGLSGTSTITVAGSGELRGGATGLCGKLMETGGFAGCPGTAGVGEEDGTFDSGSTGFGTGLKVRDSAGASGS